MPQQCLDDPDIDPALEQVGRKTVPLIPSSESAAHVRGAGATKQSDGPKPVRCAHGRARATYMGHVNIYATYWYPEATADLVRDIAVAGEAFMSEGRRA